MFGTNIYDWPFIAAAIEGADALTSALATGPLR
jgi:hypothetical protein